ncbi:peptidylprolyl isomerase [Jannaschia ovalis]|uniref:Peptidylprolyl isomerase n=1 Tax=Jannaschia ovalis TaxID=3038773 RepID=A0ABY8LAA5_9RHOB|nr:peptidylprolyl isomerase [Jannaschia sp. GRR-S6-38]WGH78277.1 peptidylprolyl isomerase [Jannaschia sp. GRR-S6-38]
MAEERRKKKSNAVVWAVLALLILALGGFGIGSFGGSLSSVAEVGDREITVEDYGRALQNEQARLAQQTGQNLTMAQLQTFGIDRAVMERLLAEQALAWEAGQMGLSVGDAEVAERIRATPAFGGLDGGFDRDGYAFALRNAGLSEAEYEARVRDDVATELLQAAVLGGTESPEARVDALVAWLAETRDATLATVTVADLPAGITAPTEADLQAFYEENLTRFETPERREITYAWITPDLLVDAIEPDETALRELYEARADEYRQPARVLAERLAFPDAAAAEAARAAIAAGETDFDALVAERGLTLDDVDQGEIAADDVDAPVAEALFGLEDPGVVGPVETLLGPTLFRVYAILDPTEVPFEEARDDLAAEFAADAARRRIDAARDEIDDLLAGGATLEELAAETDLQLGSIGFDETVIDGIAGYDEFRAAALDVTEGDFPELETLSDGGLFALRLDGVTPPATPPLADIRDAVEAAWQADTLRRRLSERAEELAAAAELPGTPETLAGLGRDARLEGTPPALLDALFEAEPEAVFAVEGGADAAYVVRLDAVNEADLSDPETAELREALIASQRQEIATDLFSLYGRAVQARAGFTVDQQAVQAVQAQLLGQ